ncbi:hypothetical protein A2U01_0054141, partial [Trifolium medium]|nr:hypothetical protein [Trifolium medium]
QEAMAYRERVSAYFYPRYPTMTDFDGAHMRRIESMHVVHEINRATYIRQRRAADLPDEGPSHVPFPGNMPRFDDDHAQLEQD